MATDNVTPLAPAAPSNVVGHDCTDEEAGPGLTLTDDERGWWRTQAAELRALHGAFTDEHWRALTRLLMLGRAVLPLHIAGEEDLARQVHELKVAALEELGLLSKR